VVVRATQFSRVAIDEKGHINGEGTQMSSRIDKALDSVTEPCRGIAVWPIRLAMAGIFIFHGVGKLMMPAMAGMMGLSLPVWYVVAGAELAGGIGFILGGLLSGHNGVQITRLSGLAIIPVMLGAIFMVHWGQWGFMASETHPGGGMEFQVLILAVSFYALVTGFANNKAKA
jgi:putative oxidoreductase